MFAFIELSRSLRLSDKYIKLIALYELSFIKSRGQYPVSMISGMKKKALFILCMVFAHIAWASQGTLADKVRTMCAACHGQQGNSTRAIMAHIGWRIGDLFVQADASFQAWEKKGRTL